VAFSAKTPIGWKRSNANGRVGVLTRGQWLRKSRDDRDACHPKLFLLVNDPAGARHIRPRPGDPAPERLTRSIAPANLPHAAHLL
jgi:hypothetical protein